ncbi:MAG: hypothetical protein P8171_24080 [Candidatus Thiodiazotropha sp.]
MGDGVEGIVPVAVDEFEAAMALPQLRGALLHFVGKCVAGLTQRRIGPAQTVIEPHYIGIGGRQQQQQQCDHREPAAVLSGQVAEADVVENFVGADAQLLHQLPNRLVVAGHRPTVGVAGDGRWVVVGHGEQRRRDAVAQGCRSPFDPGQGPFGIQVGTDPEVKIGVGAGIENPDVGKVDLAFGRHPLQGVGAHGAGVAAPLQDRVDHCIVGAFEIQRGEVALRIDVVMDQLAQRRQVATERVLLDSGETAASQILQTSDIPPFGAGEESAAETVVALALGAAVEQGDDAAGAVTHVELHIDGRIGQHEVDALGEHTDRYLLLSPQRR